MAKSSRRISDRAREEEIEISLRNHKKEAVEIVVVERFYGDWQIEKSSYPFVKKDATTAEWKVRIPAQGETTLAYTAMIQW